MDGVFIDGVSIGRQPVVKLITTWAHQPHETSIFIVNSLGA